MEVGGSWSGSIWKSMEVDGSRWKCKEAGLEVDGNFHFHQKNKECVSSCRLQSSCATPSTHSHREFEARVTLCEYPT